MMRSNAFDSTVERMLIESSAHPSTLAAIPEIDWGPISPIREHDRG
jgi:hypothetical protein